MNAPLPSPERAEAAGLIARNVAAVRARVAEACARSGRDPAGVTLLAVTKHVGLDEVRTLARLGIRDVGENRVASLRAKHNALRNELPGLRWHMIGHLQRNKVKRVMARIHLLHSGDNLPLLRAVSAELGRRGIHRRFPVHVQVNVSGERTKGGFPPDEVADVCRQARRMPQIRLAGLMTMARRVNDPEQARPWFRRLREMRDELCSLGYLEGRDLSMGMSDDFVPAVEEGATLVRLGRILLADPNAARRAEVGFDAGNGFDA